MKSFELKLKYPRSRKTRILIQKQKIREEVKRKRHSLGLLKKISLNKKIRANLENLQDFKNAKTILIYTSMKDEVDTLKIIKKHFKEKRLILPTVCKDSNTLKLYHLENLKELKKGYQGILEIPHCTKNTTLPSEIELCIIPGLAFDLNGNRIGYGKGFFDSLLKNIHAKKIALAYDFQIYETLPCHEDDVPINSIITESQIINI
ncbi:MAG: hypothetical protein ACD_65C00133G0001 [uncultured bacterium]|nr:MAG: hypothetical protein ACD_65C00133G0001 [uncultured bacterium]KKT01611.1 MAG: 5-formyltetrahydrofolate cyclo-ligase, 5-formyltetrahydrofolate cyclo-ligase [Candidatus Peregrinibacteria bacterium GW2011_GWF2_43_17]